MSKNIVYIEIDNIKYEGILNCNINLSILGFNRSFVFSVPPREIEKFNISKIEEQTKIQDEVKIYIDDNLIISGYIEKFDISYDANNYDITLSGRDKTGDLTDSSIKQNNYNIRDLTKLFIRVLADNDINDIEVINETGERLLLDKDEKIETEREETIFDFIDKYCRKKQVLARSDENGNIILQRESKEASIGELISEKENGANNIISARYNATTSDRYKFIDVYSQANNNYHTEQAIDQRANIIDNGVKRNRRKIITFDDATSSDFLKSFANWFKNLKIAKSQNYSCRVQGFYVNDNLILPNKIITVKDDKAGLNSDYLIQDVSFNASIDGIFTDITLVKTGLFNNTQATTEKQSLIISDFI